MLRRGIAILVSAAGFASAAGPDTFVAVHCEPTHLAYYPALVRLVSLADSFDARLTLEFNPQWADTILANPPLLVQVRGWQAEGHEIAAHHHSVQYGAGGWDGYTNRPAAEYPIPARFRGDMQAFYALLSLLAGDSLLLTGGITDWDVDWPAGIPFRTEGHRMSEALARPTAMILNGQPVTSLGYGLINKRSAVDSAKFLYASAGPLDVLGLVLHEKDFDENSMNLRSWLEFLRIRGAAVKTVRTILRERGFPASVPGSNRPESPGRCTLSDAFPNPFNQSARIVLEAKALGSVRLAVFDAAGRAVRTLVSGRLSPGSHEIFWDGLDDQGRILPSGLYLCRLFADGAAQTRRMVLMK